MMSADESILLSRHARFFVRHISGVDPGDHYRPAFNFQEPRFEEYPKRLTRIFREESARAPETAARAPTPERFRGRPLRYSAVSESTQELQIETTAFRSMDGD